MTGKKLQLSWKPDHEHSEVAVPLMMRTVLRVSRILCAEPVRLRRVRTWRVALSPPLVAVQRLIAVLSSIMAVTASVLTKNGPDGDQRSRSIVFLSIFATALVMSTYSLVTGTAPGRLKHLICLLREMQKIKTSIVYKCASKLHARMLIAYIIWHGVTIVEDWIWNLDVIKAKDNVKIVFLFCGFYYQLMVTMMMLLQWSVLVMELKSTTTLLNDYLESQLMNTKQPEFDIEYILHFNDCHEMIANMIAQINQKDGPFLLLSFISIFLRLVITPHTLMTGFGTYDRNIYLVYHVIRQTNWLLFLFGQLIMLIEPCQRLQNQMGRARSLLCKAVGDAGYHGVDPELLEMIVLQMEMRSAEISPMGVFTLARSLIASVICGVATYLIILIQIQNAPQINQPHLNKTT